MCLPSSELDYMTDNILGRCQSSNTIFKATDGGGQHSLRAEYLST